jgi:hypothetical protein
MTHIGDGGTAGAGVDSPESKGTTTSSNIIATIDATEGQ